MSWESVKAFCRRQTQFVGEKYRGASKTEDPEVEKSSQLVLEFQRVSKSTVLHMEILTRLWSETISTFEALAKDWENLSANVEELGVYSKRLEITANDMKGRLGSMASQFTTTIEPMRRFEHDCNAMSNLLADRKAKMLEYDFFKNKVAGLKASPPADTARIPRNEQRVDEWKRSYEDANEKVKQVCQSLLGNGSRALVQSGQVITNECGKFFDDAGKGARAILLQQPAVQQVNAAMNQAQMAMANALQKQASMGSMPPQQPSAATATTQSTGAGLRSESSASIPPNQDAFPPSQSTPNFNQQQSQQQGGRLQPSAASSRRFGGDDDPFKV